MYKYIDEDEKAISDKRREVLKVEDFIRSFSTRFVSYLFTLLFYYLISCVLVFLIFSRTIFVFFLLVLGQSVFISDELIKKIK